MSRKIKLKYTLTIETILSEDNYPTEYQGRPEAIAEYENNIDTLFELINFADLSDMKLQVTAEYTDKEK